jgi:preprotein translocase subunit YajC
MFLNIQSVLLQAQQPAGGSMMSLLFMLGMIAVLYFFMIRPQAKRAKEQKKFGDTIAVGEKIVTTAGIHASIVRANDDGTLKVEVSNGTFMTIERSAVSMEMTNAHRKKTAAATTATAAK